MGFGVERHATRTEMTVCREHVLVVSWCVDLPCPSLVPNVSSAG